jgi:hypothetical protein
VSGPSPHAVPEPSLGELFSRFSQDFGQLVRDEVQLAKTEISDDLRDAAHAGAMFGGAAYAGLMALLLLSLAAAWGLSEVMPVGVAFVIVGLLWTAAGAVLYLRGRKQWQDVNLKPEATIATIQEDVQWVKQQTS